MEEIFRAKVLFCTVCNFSAIQDVGLNYNNVKHTLEYCKEYDKKRRKSLKYMPSLMDWGFRWYIRSGDKLEGPFPVRPIIEKPS